MGDEEGRKRTPLSVAVGRRLREIRKARGMTLQQLADAVGGDKGALSRTERGERWLSDDLAQKLADVLGVAPQAFYLTQREGAAATAAQIVERLPAKRQPTALRQLEVLLQEND